MNPSTAPRRIQILALATAASMALPCARAQDGQTVDIAQMLQALHQLRDQTAAKTKADKQKAIQQVTAAAANGETAIAVWQNAEMAVHFDGVSREATAFKAWRDGEGEALKTPAGKNAARLYFEWLAITLQHSAGASVKDLLPAIINYTKELAADQVAMSNLDDSIERQKERADGKHGIVRRSNGGEAEKMHDSILDKPLGGSLVVQWMKIGEWVNLEKWEGAPGNYDGIFEKIVLPEMRAERDKRVLDYWDLKIKTESEDASKSKLEFERDKFNSFRLPSLLWKRSVDLALLGFKNRAANDMFNLIRKYPSHPEAAEWMAKLEEMLAPAAPTAPPSEPAAAASTLGAAAVPPSGAAHSAAH